MPGAVTPTRPNQGWAHTSALDNTGSAATSWKMRTQLWRHACANRRQDCVKPAMTCSGLEPAGSARVVLLPKGRLKCVGTLGILLS